MSYNYKELFPHASEYADLPDRERALNSAKYTLSKVWYELGKQDGATLLLDSEGAISVVIKDGFDPATGACQMVFDVKYSKESSGSPGLASKVHSIEYRVTGIFLELVSWKVENMSVSSGVAFPVVERTYDLKTVDLKTAQELESFLTQIAGAISPEHTARD